MSMTGEEKNARRDATRREASQVVHDLGEPADTVGCEHDAPSFAPERDESEQLDDESDLSSVA